MTLCVLSYHRSESRTDWMWRRQGHAPSTLQASLLIHHGGWEIPLLHLHEKNSWIKDCWYYSLLLFCSSTDQTQLSSTKNIPLLIESNQIWTKERRGLSSTLSSSNSINICKSFGFRFLQTFQNVCSVLIQDSQSQPPTCTERIATITINICFAQVVYLLNNSKTL